MRGDADTPYGAMGNNPIAYLYLSDQIQTSFGKCFVALPIHAM